MVELIIHIALFLYGVVTIWWLMYEVAVVKKNHVSRVEFIVVALLSTFYPVNVAAAFAISGMRLETWLREEGVTKKIADWFKSEPKIITSWRNKYGSM